MDTANLRVDWRERLLVTPTHQPRPQLTNALLALREAPEWAGVLAYDEFALAVMAMQPPPWVLTNGTWEPCRWTDREDALATDWLQRQGIGVPVSVGANAVETAAKDASFHPIRDYLSGLKWDGKKRLVTFTADYLGSEDTSYHTAVGQCSLIASAARIMEPGCKADHVIILEGPQGALKSSAIEALFTPWFSDDISELGTKDAAMQVRAAWGIEIAELAAMRRGEIERVKAFVARRVDRFRPSYGRRVIEVPRQSVFFGTTNTDNYLKDETGGRRFWPVVCGTINLGAIRRDKDQLWAEAVHLYRAGAEWWLTDKLDIAAAAEVQEGRYEGDPWEAKVLAYIAVRESVSTDEVLSEALFKSTDHQTPADAQRVAKILRGAKWVRQQRRPQCLRRFYPPSSR